MTSSSTPQAQASNDHYVKVDPFSGELYTVNRIAEDRVSLIHMVAEFKTIIARRTFTERYLHSGKSFEANVKQHHREVRWDALLFPHSDARQYVIDLLENVEAVGGTSARLGYSKTDTEPVATLRPYRSY